MSTRSHEWDDVYRRSDAPPWDIDRPQQAFQSLADRGLLSGALLDAGCGTGEHTLLAAAHGAVATGVDLSGAAIERAREKAQQRGLTARFECGDVLALPLPHASFDTVVDSGLFHVFDDEDRQRYVATLARALRPEGICYLMCFSDKQPGDWGPRRVTQAELREAFADGWTFERIDAAQFEVNPHPDVDTPVVQAWLVTVRRQA